MAKIINKGIRCYVKVHGNGLIAGEEYTACLYASPKKEEFRATAVAVAEDINGEIVCSFDFTPDQTALLKVGNVIFEVFDGNYRQMKYDEQFATVRATSISA